MAGTLAGVAARGALLFFSLVIFVASGELALRAVYRDGGKRTLGAPGFFPFEYVNTHDQQRGRLDYGAKTLGIPRVLTVGDSITWGTGVREWQDTWPEQLAQLYEGAGVKRQFAVLSLPGRDIDAHTEQVRLWVEEIDPDIFIYQWYVNDLETLRQRPATQRVWQRVPWHEGLRRASYLYYFLDNRFSMLLPPIERSYVEYIRTDFIDGSLEWSEFERWFHELASRAREHARTRVLVLYPQVPFSGDYPLAGVHERLTRLATATRLSIPPAVWIRAAGQLVSVDAGRWKQGVRVPAGAAPRTIVTRPYYANSVLDLELTASTATAGESVIGTLDVLDAETQQLLASAPVRLPVDEGSFRRAELKVPIAGPAGRRVQLAFGGTSSEVTLAELDLRVDYGFDVLDLTDTMNAFDTHVSIFDAHPNPRAHQVVAEEVYKRLNELEAGRQGASADRLLR